MPGTTQLVCLQRDALSKMADVEKRIGGPRKKKVLLRRDETKETVTFGNMGVWYIFIMEIKLNSVKDVNARIVTTGHDVCTSRILAFVRVRVFARVRKGVCAPTALTRA